MTLTRNPISDFDTMSLFQDLKLKRRKIDSRCSSDGESIADTSTSSPDMAAPISPSPIVVKTLDHTRISPSPGSCSLPHDNRVCSQENEILDNNGIELPMETDDHPIVINGCGSRHLGSLKIKEEPSVYDGGGINSEVPGSGGSDEGGSEMEDRMEVHVNHNNINCVNRKNSRGETMVNGNCHNNVNVIKNAIRVKCTNDIIGDIEEHHHQQQQRRESVVVSGASAIAASWNSSCTMVDQQESNAESSASPEEISRPNSAVTKNDSSNSSSSSSSTSSISSVEIAPVSTPNNLYCSVISSPPRLWVTTTTTSPSVLNACRINGVRPELIGGVNYCDSMKPPVMLPQRPTSSGLRTTPTVIMGEAGGVRTMIWSTPMVDQVNNQQSSGSSSTSPHHQSQTSLPSHQQQSALHQQQSALYQQHQLQQQSSIITVNSTQSSWTQPSVSSSLANSESKSSPAHIIVNSNHDPNIHHITGVRPLTSLINNLPQQQQHRLNSSSSLPVPLNMERLWAGDLSQLPASQQIQALNLTSPNSSIPPWQHFLKTNGDISNMTKLLPSHHNSEEPMEDDEQPMICMICEDKATGLHYGIITCEGCKGFFKRTVQNRRVYTCVADGICEITKAQRNRCQYCRFKKCLEQGMVLQAVREDRMPGGRNSGAVYNLYKVKYKKHKKATRNNGQIKMEKQLQHQNQEQQIQQQQRNHLQPHQQTVQHTHHQSQQSPPQQSHHQQQNHQQQPQQQSPQSQQQDQQKFPNSESSVPSHPRTPHLINGTILKTALTNPSEVVYLRQRLDNTVTSSRDRSLSIDNSFSMIQTLVDCDEFQDIATLQNLEDLLEHKSDLSDKLMQIGDSIVYKLVQWTKRLPFYLELPVEVHTRLLTHRWHELLVLTTSAYQAIHGSLNNINGHINNDHTSEAEFNELVLNNLRTLQACLTSMMGRPITIDQLRQDVGLMVEKITHVTLMFRQIRLRMEEYVCLKVIIMLNPARASCTELETIQERYMTCLRMYIEQTSPQQPNRFHDLLVRLPEVQSAASLLLESKMFYVPFLLNSTIHR